MTNKTVDVAVTDLSGDALIYAIGMIEMEWVKAQAEKRQSSIDEHAQRRVYEVFGASVSIPAVLMDKGE